MKDFIQDPKLREELGKSDRRVIMVIGGSDTGKTTLVAGLADSLSRGSAAALVDLDVGQSHIGPPATVAWARVEGGFRDWSDLSVESFYFTGAVSPLGNLLPAVVGAKVLTDKAAAVSEKVIIDTSGLIAEPAGRVLKQFKIDVIAPDIVIALQRADELDHILRAFRLLKRPAIYRVAVPEQVKAKSTEKRGRYRFERFLSHLSDADLLELPLESVGVRYTGGPMPVSPSGLENRIVCFRSRDNTDLALGFIDGVSPCGGTVMIRTHLSGLQDVAALVIGRAVIDRTRREVRDWVVHGKGGV